GDGQDRIRRQTGGPPRRIGQGGPARDRRPVLLETGGGHADRSHRGHGRRRRSSHHRHHVPLVGSESHGGRARRGATHRPHHTRADRLRRPHTRRRGP